MRFEHFIHIIFNFSKEEWKLFLIEVQPDPYKLSLFDFSALVTGSVQCSENDSLIMMAGFFFFNIGGKSVLKFVKAYIDGSYTLNRSQKIYIFV